MKPITPLMRGVLEAIRDLEAEEDEKAKRLNYRRGHEGQPPNWIGARVSKNLGLTTPRRLGNGAVKGSWSGTMADCARTSSPCYALTKRGLLEQHLDRSHGYTQVRYSLTDEGRAALEADE